MMAAPGPEPHLGGLAVGLPSSDDQETLISCPHPGPRIQIKIQLIKYKNNTHTNQLAYLMTMGDMLSKNEKLI